MNSKYALSRYFVLMRIGVERYIVKLFFGTHIVTDCSAK